VLTGLLFRDRAFCRGFCPVGLMLGRYGRGGMITFRTGPPAVCRQCRTRDCVASDGRTRLDARSCPSLLNPPRLASNQDCLLCLQCVKACPFDNVQVLLRHPFPATDVRPTLAGWPLTLFAMLVSGFVVWELLTEWPAAEQRFLAVPARVAARTGWSAARDWLEGPWALAIVPAGLWLGLAALARALGAPGSVAHHWRRLALLFVRTLYARREHRLAHAHGQMTWRHHAPVLAFALACGAIIVGWTIS
jgi:ferredoxin